MEKLLTVKEFIAEITPFVKAYKRKNTYKIFGIVNEFKIGENSYLFVSVDRYPNKIKKIHEKDIHGFRDENKFEEKIVKKGGFKLHVDFYETEDSDGDSVFIEIESEGNTTTEIVDFLSFEYNENVLKKFK